MVYKILTPDAWADMCSSGSMVLQGVDATDGFVHFSTAAQVQATLDKHYQGHDDLIILAVNAERFGSDMKWEVSRGGDLFPHLYNQLRPSDVEAHFSLTSTRVGFDAWLSQMSGTVS